jgi:hypothetical protein
MGIQRQMKAQLMDVRGTMQYFVPRASPELRLTPAPKLVNDGKANTTANEPGTINVRRASMLNYLKPVWS